MEADRKERLGRITYRDMWRHEPTRMGVIVAVLIAVSVPFTGAAAFAFFASQLLDVVWLSQNSASQLILIHNSGSFSFQLGMDRTSTDASVAGLFWTAFLVSFCNFYLYNRFGRRPLLISTLFTLTVITSLIAVCAYIVRNKIFNYYFITGIEAVFTTLIFFRAKITQKVAIGWRR